MAGLPRLLFVLFLFALVTVPLLPFQMFAWKLQRFWHKALPHWWQKFMCRLLGFRLHRHGAMANGRPLLIVANHVSWSDILVLGAIGKVSFVAKSDMESWPVFGFFAKLQRTIFIHRENRQNAGEQANEIAMRLRSGDALVLFPEGTTSDGNRVLPFKSSLFGAAKAVLEKGEPPHPDHVLIQPVALAYNRVQGLPTGRYHRNIAAWPGSVGLIKHLKGVVAAGAVDVSVVFGDPVEFRLDMDRKAVAARLEREVRAMTAAALRFAPHESPYLEA